jgi:3-isopropylmalate/(R)-2-methylmalate dehydratase large subunit
MRRTLLDKIWDAHELDGGLLYVDLHLVHEVTSAQAFQSLASASRRVRRPDRTLATVDHNVPTDGTRVTAMIREELSRKQVETLEKNCAEFGVPIYSLGSAHQGIVHVVSPQLGTTQPGMTIVCGDSHTSTHGAFGALAFGIGTSEVEHVLVTQCLLQKKPKSMRIKYIGKLGFGVTAKDLILGTIGQIGVDGGRGHVIEYTGDAILAMTMEERMTVCNMSIECGARAGMIGPDATTLAWFMEADRPGGPKGSELASAAAAWMEMRSDSDASFDAEIIVDASAISPQVTWGTNPAMVVPVDGVVPNPKDMNTDAEREEAERALVYMGLEPGTLIRNIPLDRIFIGSCTNARISDLRAAAKVVDGQHIAPSVKAMVVPGSQQVKEEAESEGLDEIFRAAGFDWRSAGDERRYFAA